MNTSISLIGLAAVFALAYGLDRWTEVLQRQAVQNFAWAPFFWSASIGNLFLAVSLFLLAWFVCFRANKNQLISAAFVIVGLLATFAFAVEYSTSSISPHFMIVPLFLAPNSRVAYVSAFVTVIGIASLLLSKK